MFSISLRDSRSHPGYERSGWEYLGSYLEGGKGETEQFLLVSLSLLRMTECHSQERQVKVTLGAWHNWLRLNELAFRHKFLLNNLLLCIPTAFWSFSVPEEDCILK